MKHTPGPLTRPLVAIFPALLSIFIILAGPIRAGVHVVEGTDTLRNLGKPLMPIYVNSHEHDDPPSSCANSNFATGDFTNWTGCYGTYFPNTCTQPGFWMTPTATHPLHKIIPSPGWVDANTSCTAGISLTTAYPGEAYVARIGDTMYTSPANTYWKAAEIKYPVAVTPQTNFFIYRYAVVLQSGGHDPDQQPDFLVEITDASGAQLDPVCGVYHFTAPKNGPAPTGWNKCGNDPNALYWKDWTTVGMDLSDYMGTTVYVRFKVQGCVYQTHYGYAYVSAYCSSMNIAIAGCEGTGVVTMTAPPGFAAYEWRGPGPTGPIVGTTQSCTITAAQGAVTGNIFYCTLTAVNGCVLEKAMQTIMFTSVTPGFSAVVNCVGNQSTFTDISTSTNPGQPIVSRKWRWEATDPFTAVTTNAVATHVFPTTGVHEVTVVSYSQDNCEGTFTQNINVGPPPLINGLTPKSICSGQSVNQTLDMSQVGADAIWTSTVTSGTATITSNPAGQSGTQINDVIVNNGPGDAVVTYTLTPEIGNCIGSPITWEVTVHPLPVPILTGPSTCCIGVNGNIFSSDPGMTNYTWTVASGTFVPGALPESVDVTWSAVGAHQITVNYTDVNGCSAATPKTVTVNVNPSGQVNQPTDLVVCPGAPASTAFSTVIATGTTSYAWTNSNTDIGLAASGTGNISAFPAVNPGLAPVSGTITVTPTYSNGGTDCIGPDKTFSITVNPSGDVTQPADLVTCPGDPVQVTFLTSNTVGTTTYAWTNSNTTIGLGAGGNGDIAFSTVNTGPGPQIATITVTPTFSYLGTNCTGPVKTFTVTVNPHGDVLLPSNQVKCNGETTDVDFNSGNTGSGTTSYTWTNTNTTIGLAAAGTGDIASFSLINIGTLPEVATITVVPTYTGTGIDCAGPSKTFSITVNPTGEVVQPVDLVVCPGDITPAVFTSINTGGTTSYAWTNSNTAIGLAASGTGNISFVAVNGGLSPVTATIQVTPTFSNGGSNCTGTAKSFTITVNPAGNVVQPVSPVKCNGDLFGMTFSSGNLGGTTTYSWTNSNTAIGLPGNGTGDILPFTAQNNGTDPITATIDVTPTFTNGGTSCTGTSKQFVITVNPTAAMVQPPDVVKCPGDNASTTFATLNNGGTTTYAWTCSNTAVGLAGSGTGDISFTTTNPGLAPIAATVTVTPTFTNGGTSCPGPAKQFTITVNPAGDVTQPVNLVNCPGEPVQVVWLTSNSIGTTTYAWTNSNTNIGLGANGNGDVAFTTVNTGLGPQVATITVTPTFSYLGTNCTGNAKTFTITVNPSGDVLLPTNQVKCNGQTTDVIFNTGNTGTGITSYAWTNTNTTIGLAAAGVGDIPSFVLVNNGTMPEVATITVVPTYTRTGVGCAGPSKSFTITVNPTGEVVQPSSLVVCPGDLTPAVFASVNTGGTTTYDWTNSNTTIGLAATGTGNISFSAVNPGLSPVTATIQVTPTFTNGGTSCTGAVKSFTITVNPTGNVVQPGSPVKCNGDLTSVTFSSANLGGTTTYTWTNTNTTIGLPPNGSGNILPFNAQNNGTDPVLATIEVTPTFTNGGTSCTGTPKQFTITVNPTAAMVQPVDLVKCPGDNASTVFVTLNNGGTTTYAWTCSNTAIGLSGTGTGDISFTTTNPGLAPIAATITATPTFTNGGTSCSGPAKQFSITVNPVGQVVQPGNQVKCNLDNTSVTFNTLNAGGTTSYLWSNTDPSIGLPAAGTGDILPFQLTNGGTSPVTATISVTPVFSGGGTSCTGVTKSFTIQVNPTAEVNQPASQVICPGASVLVPFATVNTGGVTTYAWTCDNPAIGLAASGAGNISFTATNPGIAPLVANVTVTPTFTASGNPCPGPAKMFTLTVNPVGDVQAQPAQVKCNNDLTTVTFATANAGGTTTYAWTNSNTNTGLSATGTGDISFLATNPGTAPITTTITVTPTFTFGGTSCTGSVKTISITVNPSAQVNQPVNLARCHGTSASVAFSTANAGGATVYTWTNDTPSIGLAASGTGDITPFTVSNASAAPVTATITVTPHYTSGSVTCEGTPKVFTIVVNPLPIPTLLGPAVACAGSSNLIYSTDPTPTNTGYQWSITGGGVITGGTGTYAVSVTWNNVGSPTISVNYTDLNGCTAVSPTTRTISVQTLPTPTITGVNAVCVNQVETYTTEAGASSYSWNIPAVGVTKLSGGGAGENFVQLRWDAPAGYDISVNYSIGIGCMAVTPTVYHVTANANPTPQILGATAAPICGYSSQNYFTTGAPGHTYAWTIVGGTPATGTNSSITVLWGNSLPVSVDLIETAHYPGVSCSTTALSHYPTFAPWPVAAGDITGPASVCLGWTSQTYTVPPIANADTYEWSYTGTGVTLVPAGSSVNLNFSMSATSGFLTVKGHNNCGYGPVSANYSITVHDLPVVSYSICSDALTTKNGKPFLLKGGSPDGPTGTYHLNSPLAAPLAGNMLNPADPLVVTGNNTIYYTYTNAYSCKSTAQQVINVQPSNAGLPCLGTMTDPRDNASYKIIQMGTQCWFQENLRYGGTTRIYIDPQADNCLFEKYCLSADPNCTLQGGFYQWDELMQYNGISKGQGFCPPGWHVPSDAEWDVLINFVSANAGNGVAGSFLKDMIQPGSFKGDPQGVFYLNSLQSFTTPGVNGTLFWTSTQGTTGLIVTRGLNFNTPSVSKYESEPLNAFPVRCVKD